MQDVDWSTVHSKLDEAKLSSPAVFDIQLQSLLSYHGYLTGNLNQAAFALRKHGAL
jgi:hypothetical protein